MNTKYLIKRWISALFSACSAILLLILLLRFSGMEMSFLETMINWPDKIIYYMILLIIIGFYLILCFINYKRENIEKILSYNEEARINNAPIEAEIAEWEESVQQAYEHDLHAYFNAVRTGRSSRNNKTLMKLKEIEMPLFYPMIFGYLVILYFLLC